MFTFWSYQSYVPLCCVIYPSFLYEHLLSLLGHVWSAVGYIGHTYIQAFVITQAGYMCIQILRQLCDWIYHALCTCTNMLHTSILFGYTISTYIRAYKHYSGVYYTYVCICIRTQLTHLKAKRGWVKGILYIHTCTRSPLIDILYAHVHTYTNKSGGKLCINMHYITQ